jgi:hypothetical protein
MAIVQPGNAALARLATRIADTPSRTGDEIEAVVVTGRTEKTLRLVSYNRRISHLTGFKSRSPVPVEEDCAGAIATLLGENDGAEIAIAHEGVAGSTCRWVFWNPIDEVPQLVDGEELAESYIPVL